MYFQHKQTGDQISIKDHFELDFDEKKEYRFCDDPKSSPFLFYNRIVKEPESYELIKGFINYESNQKEFFAKSSEEKKQILNNLMLLNGSGNNS